MHGYGSSSVDWEGGPRWYNEPTLTDFYRSTFGPGESFLSLHDPNKTGIASWTNAPGDDIFTGVASYNEQAGAPLATAGDGIGMQYGAELAHARLTRARAAACDASDDKAAGRLSQRWRRRRQRAVRFLPLFL